jgi:serine/threonine protein kinase
VVKKCTALEDPESHFAVKILRNPCEEYRMQAKKEFDLLKDIDHPNIVKMNELYDHAERETLYFVMELCPGPTLMQHI